MKRELPVVLILALAACAGVTSTVISRDLQSTTARIVGGEDTTIEDYPYQVSLLYLNSHRCGGAIIHEYYILTAAHCVYSISSATYLQIRSGSSYRTSGGTLHDLAWFTWHRSFSAVTYEYDIALIRVKLPFEFGRSVQPIELASTSYTVADGTMLTVTGWGALNYGGVSPLVLQVVEVPSMNNTYCAELYAYLNPVTSTMICAGYEAGGKDACQGDSGGPLAYGNTLLGIVSWGDGCAGVYQPGVYASVSSLRDWIIETTGIDFY